MDKPRTFDRTIPFDEELLRQLNEYALRKGQLLEQWLPIAIKEILLPNLNREPSGVGLGYLSPGKDFNVPFPSNTFSTDNVNYHYELGDYEIEEKNWEATRRVDLKGSFNRLFPVVLCVRVVALYSQSGPISEAEYYTMLRKHAYQVRLSLLSEMQMHYRQRGPYDGLPGHRSESRIRTSEKEQSSWIRFVRYFARVGGRPGSGGLAQRLNLITMNRDGEVVLTTRGETLAKLKNPVLDDWNFGYDERIVSSTLSHEESEFLCFKLSHSHPREYDRMCELVNLLVSRPMTRGELLEEFEAIKHKPRATKSAELNGLMGRMIDLHLIDKQAHVNFRGDGRSSNLYTLKKNDRTAEMIERFHSRR